ncbi:MAG: hypothetical protein JSW27_04230 [Phycisphaerales bacterium]|nr:MAG: hypothetical protein JSW27_04230 [Phycisphaerales bacterium]
MDNVKRLLVLEKGAELFVFGYRPGQEARVLETLIAQAKDPRTDFDWFDVAVLELKLKDVSQSLPQAPAPPTEPVIFDRFQLPCDKPLWFMRGLFGPDGDRH